MTDALAATIGTNIRTIREQRGLSQRALGRAAGVSGTAVRGWELGDGQITAAHLVAVADALDVSVTRLLGRDNGNAFEDGWNAGWDACRAAMHVATDLSAMAGPADGGAL